MDEIQSLEQQIAELQAKKHAIIEAKRLEALTQARELVKVYGFSATELGISAVASKSVKLSSAGVKAAPKYANPENTAETWHGGKGPKPKWVKALLEAGKNLEDYLIHRN